MSTEELDQSYTDILTVDCSDSNEDFRSHRGSDSPGSDFHSSINAKKMRSLSPRSREDLRLRVNSRERTRMHDLNGAMDALRQVMPYAQGPAVKKLSKMNTLLLARNYIMMLSRTVEEMRRLLSDVYRQPLPATSIPSIEELLRQRVGSEDLVRHRIREARPAVSLVSPPTTTSIPAAGLLASLPTSPASLITPVTHFGLPRPQPLQHPTPLSLDHHHHHHLLGSLPVPGMPCPCSYCLGVSKAIASKS